MKGSMCPDFPYETLEFKVKSDILGTSTFKFDFKVEPKGEVKFFNFEFDLTIYVIILKGLLYMKYDESIMRGHDIMIT